MVVLGDRNAEGSPRGAGGIGGALGSGEALGGFGGTGCDRGLGMAGVGTAGATLPLYQRLR